MMPLEAIRRRRELRVPVEMEEPADPAEMVVWENRVALEAGVEMGNLATRTRE